MNALWRMLPLCSLPLAALLATAVVAVSEKSKLTFTDATAEVGLAGALRGALNHAEIGRAHV